MCIAMTPSIKLPTTPTKLNHIEGKVRIERSKSLSLSSSMGKLIHRTDEPSIPLTSPSGKIPSVSSLLNYGPVVTDTRNSSTESKSSTSSVNISPLNKSLYKRRDSLEFLADTALHTASNSPSLTPEKNDQPEYYKQISTLIELKNSMFDGSIHWPISTTLIETITMEQLNTLLNKSEQLTKVVKSLIISKLKTNTRIENADPNIKKGYEKIRLPSVNELRQSIPDQLPLPLTSHQRQSLPPTFFKFPLYNRFQMGITNTIPTPESNSIMRRRTVHGSPMRGVFSVNFKPITADHRSTLSDSIIPAVINSMTENEITSNAKIRKDKKLKVIKPNHKRRLSSNAGQGVCLHCHENDTPEWRRGPYGNRTLCNACGLFYNKLVRKFNLERANILMLYRKTTFPENRRVPEFFNVEESFIDDLKKNELLDERFSYKIKPSIPVPPLIRKG